MGGRRGWSVLSRIRPDLSGDGFIDFAGADWWVHGRAHADFQVSSQMSRVRPVLIVSSLGMRFPTPGRTSLPFRRMYRKARATVRILRRPIKGNRNLWVLSPVFIPIYRDGMLRRLSNTLVRGQIAVAKKILGVELPHVIVTVPTAVDVALSLPHRSLTYYRSDNHAAAIDVDHETIRNFESRLMVAADRVLYSSRRLLEEESQRHGGKGIFFDHGVDAEHFSLSKGAPEPTDLAVIAHPRVGFFGHMEDESVDVAVLRAIAVELPDVQLVLVGKVTMDLHGLADLANVHLLGWKEYDQVADYGRGFDVGLCPMPDTPWISVANPIKLKEYLALGLPVVSTRIAANLPYRQSVLEANGPEEFVAAVRKVLAGDIASSPEQRRELVLAETWAARAEALLKMCESA